MYLLTLELLTDQLHWCDVDYTVILQSVELYSPQLLDLNQRSYKQQPSPLIIRNLRLIFTTTLFNIFSVITGAHTGCLRLS